MACIATLLHTCTECEGFALQCFHWRGKQCCLWKQTPMCKMLVQSVYQIYEKSKAESDRVATYVHRFQILKKYCGCLEPFSWYRVSHTACCSLTLALVAASYTFSIEPSDGKLKIMQAVYRPNTLSLYNHTHIFNVWYNLPYYGRKYWWELYLAGAFPQDFNLAESHLNWCLYIRACVHMHQS